MLLYGAGGHAKVIYECIKANGGEVSFIFDDKPKRTHLNDVSIIGAYDPEFNTQHAIIIAVGNNLTRKILSEKITHNFGIVIHPSVLISSYVKLDIGTVIIHGAIIQAGVIIGKHCIVNTGSIIEHDCIIDNFVHVASKVLLSGNVKIGEGSLIGAGTTIIPNIKVGKWCVIGAGTVVTKDIPDYSMVVGVPGKIVKTLLKTI